MSKRRAEIDIRTTKQYNLFLFNQIENMLGLSKFGLNRKFRQFFLLLWHSYSMKTISISNLNSSAKLDSSKYYVGNLGPGDLKIPQPLAQLIAGDKLVFPRTPEQFNEIN